MKALRRITREALRYIDDDGTLKTIDLLLCNKNWLAYQAQTGDQGDELEAEYIGWRNACAMPPSIIFFTEPDRSPSCVKFAFEYAPNCSVRDERFWNLLAQLKQVGWKTADLS